MKTRVTKGWKLFGTNEQDAYSAEARRKYDTYCIKLDRKTKRLKADELQKWIDNAYEAGVARKESYQKAKSEGILKTRKEKIALKEARKAERKAKRLAKKG